MKKTVGLILAFIVSLAAFASPINLEDRSLEPLQTFTSYRIQAIGKFYGQLDKDLAEFRYPSSEFYDDIAKIDTDEIVRTMAFGTYGLNNEFNALWSLQKKIYDPNDSMGYFEFVAKIDQNNKFNKAIKGLQEKYRQMRVVQDYYLEKSRQRYYKVEGVKIKSFKELIDDLPTDPSELLYR